MNHYKRALVSTKRMFFKSILLFTIILILSSVMSGSLQVMRAISNSENTIFNRVRPFATIEVNWEAYHENWSINESKENRGMLSVDQVRMLGELPYVSSFDFNLLGTVQSRELRLAWDENNFFDVTTISSRLNGFERLTLFGIENIPLFHELEGIISIVSGRRFTDQEILIGENVAIISSEFAVKNNIEVGSVMVLDHHIWNGQARDENLVATLDLEVEIVGLFEVSELRGTGNIAEDEMFLYRQKNFIYVPNLIVKRLEYFTHSVELDFEINRFSVQSANPVLAVEPIFILNSHIDMESFRNVVHKSLYDFLELRTSLDSFSLFLTALSDLTIITHYFLIFAIVVSIVVFSLTILIFLYDRKKEIAIYLALGASKLTIFIQISLETIMISLIAMTLSFFIGNFFANQLSATMLKDNIINLQNEVAVNQSPWGETINRDTTWLLSPPEMEIDEMLDAFDVSLSTITIITYIGVSVIIIGFVITISHFYIYKMKPKKILQS